LFAEDRVVKRIEIDEKIRKIVDDNFIIITPTGEKITGVDGFLYWCDKTAQEPIKTAEDYAKTIAKFAKHKKDGLINGLSKFKNTFNNDIFLDKMFYLDFYSIERYGKTRLGQMLLYGKQSGNKKLIKEIIQEIKPKIDRLIKKESIDGACFIPWTVRREVQFMRELERGLDLHIKSIKIEKAKTDIIVPQKTLSKLRDRIENAGKTMMVTEKESYKKVLLIDDAVGSGATLNEVARQIKNKGIAKKVIGLSITGSFKGFDVISEV
jgi:hypoxanthine-guanine phosphoribosyltransferase